MQWLTKHVDTVIVLTGILSSVFWMNGKFDHIDHQFSEIEKEVTIIKTVLIIKGIMPMELARKGEEK